MDDTAIQEFFTQPAQTYHRQYEALRAFFVDGRSQKDIAEAFGFQDHSLRQLVYEFRKSFDAERNSTEPPFFKPFADAAPQPVARNARPLKSLTARR
jgi:hypothetical protein